MINLNKKFDIPGFTYFHEKNTYTGSIGNNFNYKIVPEEKINVTLWSGKYCLAKTTEENVLDKHDFEFTREGLEEMKSWLEISYEKYTADN